MSNEKQPTSTSRSENIQMENNERSTFGGAINVQQENVTITIQPKSNNEEVLGNRRHIPVSTVEWLSTHGTQFIPIHGLQFLGGTDSILIQQTVELNEFLTGIESENRYIVKVPHGESLYFGSETSKKWQRTCFGSNREFYLNIYDQTRQEALQLKRRLACNNCIFGCYLQMMEVWAPLGDFLGLVKQDWTLIGTSFSILNDCNDIIYKINGPRICLCTSSTEVDFKILTPDGFTQLGCITHKWDHLMVGYNILVNFPERNTCIKHKALIMSAAFLLEYLYFERLKKIRCSKYLC